MIKKIILVLIVYVMSFNSVASQNYIITNSSVNKSKVRITGYKIIDKNQPQQANQQNINKAPINNVPKKNTNSYGTYSAPTRQAFKKNVLITNEMGVDKPKKEYNISKVSGLAEACKNVISAQNGVRYDDLGYGLCFGYIRGIKNYYDIAKGSSGYGKICFPKDVTWLQMIKIYLKWADENPAKLHKTAWEGVIYSMNSAFPCGFTGKG